MNNNKFLVYNIIDDFRLYNLTTEKYKKFKLNLDDKEKCNLYFSHLNTLGNNLIAIIKK